MTTIFSRRSFVKGAALATVMTSGTSIAAPSSQIRLGIIGTGNRGGRLIDLVSAMKQAKIVAFCDVFAPHLASSSAKLDEPVDHYSDYRKLLERNDIDAVMIASPDHWHAIHTVDACNAGKDVYVEKPMSYTVREGRIMVETAQRTNRIVQVGMQRRSSTMFAELREKLSGGAIGNITVSRASRLNNMAPSGIGNAADSDPPSNLNWDMWLGPRPKRAYNENICPYKFRWWKSYSSQMANWGVHYFDLLRWLQDEEAITSVSAHGGQFAVNDSRSIPDTMQATFEFGSGKLMLFSQFEASGNAILPNQMEIELRGTLGTLYAREGKYQIVPEHGGQFQDPAARMEATQGSAVGADKTGDHIANWLDCIKTRAQPNADAETGHRSATIAHLGNIALETGSRINWDPAKERITNNDAANDLLHYEYRTPWTLG